jgi:hypothetical protein
MSKNTNNIAFVLFIAIYTTLLCLVLFSCTTERKATGYFREHPEKLAPICAEEFPVKDSLVVKDSVRFDTLWIEGEPVILKDSFYIKGDTIVKVITKECPKVSTVIKTVTRDSIHYVENTARVVMLQNQIKSSQLENQKLQAQIALLQGKVKGKNKVIWWLAVFVAILTAWTFRRPILSIINPIKIIPPIS